MKSSRLHLKILMALFVIFGSLALVIHLRLLINHPNIPGVFLWIIELFIGLCSIFYWRTLYLGGPSVELLSRNDFLEHSSQSDMVDVFIPTLNEPLQILRKTIESAKKVLLLNQVYVLDDGQRPELKELCDELQVQYRSRGTREFAKAGNLNFAIEFSSAPFALILDADMIPTPDIFSSALPHFDETGVGIVQFPQEFYNLNSFQHWYKGDDWTDLSFGLRMVNPCRNYFKGGYWCGSPSVVKLGCLREIGGVKTTSVTEDLQTTTSLMETGYWVKSLTEKKAFGLAPEDFSSFIIQRQRWAKGFFQVWWSDASPLRLNLPKTIKTEWFGDFFYHMHMSFYFLLTQIFPFLTIVFKTTLFSESEDYLFVFGWLILLCLMYFINKLLAGPHYRIIPTQVFMRLAMFPIIVGFFESLQKENQEFEVTPKEKVKRYSTRTFLHILMIFILWAINALTFLVLISTTLSVTVFFVLAWTFINLNFLTLALHRLFRFSFR
jgi:cellulose synthase (UDP-forming)